MKKILIISDGIPGHFNQSNGVAFLIKETCDCAITTHELSWRFYALKFACNIFAKLLLRFNNKNIARGILWMYSPINIQGYDLVIAAGGNTMPVSAAIKLAYSFASHSTWFSKRTSFIYVQCPCYRRKIF